MGSRVTLVNSHGELLPFLDREVVRAFVEEMTKAGIELRNGLQIESVSVEKSSAGENVCARGADGAVIAADMFLYTAGRNGNTKDLGLDRAGLAGRRARYAESGYDVSDSRATHLCGG